MNLDKLFFVIRGIPGSGKSTLGSSIAYKCWEADKYFDFFHGGEFVPHEIGRAHEWCKERVREDMEAGIARLAVANTFTRKWEMEPYLEMAEEMGYTCIVLVVENHHGNKSVHNIPQEIIDKMVNRFEVYL